jgi:hypothetical protein
MACSLFCQSKTSQAGYALIFLNPSAWLTHIKAGFLP